MICQVCGKKAESNLCFLHKKRKVISTKQKDIAHDNANSNAMWNFFLLIWGKRSHKSEISGAYLGKEALTIFFHHIIEKEHCSEGKFDPENIILVTWDEHTNLHSNKSKYEEVNKRREYLKAKYERNKQGEKTGN